MAYKIVAESFISERRWVIILLADSELEAIRKAERDMAARNSFPVAVNPYRADSWED